MSKHRWTIEELKNVNDAQFAMAILMERRIICGLASCRAALSCGVRLPCTFNGAFAIRKLSVRRFFPHCSVPLSCRFVFDFLSKRWVTFPRVALC